jgi:hypothetical protein
LLVDLATVKRRDRLRQFVGELIRAGRVDKEVFALASEPDGPDGILIIAIPPIPGANKMINTIILESSRKLSITMERLSMPKSLCDDMERAAMTARGGLG